MLELFNFKTKIFHVMKSRMLQVDDEIELHGCDEKWVNTIFGIIEQEREYLREWQPWVDKTLEEQDTRDYMKFAHSMNKGGQQLNTWISYKGEICGSIAFVKIDNENENGEIGYWLSQKFMGRGIVTRSCERMMRYGFEQLGLVRIVIRVATENYPSIAIPKRLGMELEGIARKALKLREEHLDLYVFSQLK